MGFIFGFFFNEKLACIAVIFYTFGFADYGSYSKSIRTSNIEYLLNNGQPAFYGCYIEEENTIYFTSLKNVISELTTTNPEWQKQPNHTIRFIAKLDSTSIDDIYEIAFKEGLMQRKIQSKFAENLSFIKNEDKIIIDFDSNVTTDSEITSLIEKYGLTMVDNFQWVKIINLHKQSTNGIKTPKYNLVLGLSFYYGGEYFKALDFFKESYKNIDSLDSHLREYLIFIYYGLQRIMHVVSDEEYENVTGTFRENSDMYMYKQLELATNLMGKMYTSENHVSLEFEEKIEQIINTPNISENIILFANIEKIQYQSEQLIFKLIPLIEFGHTQSIESQFFEINKVFDSIMNRSKELNSNFINHLCSIRHSRFIIHFDCIVRRRIKSELLEQVLPQILTNIELSYLYFREINHVGNELFALSVLLEYYENLEKEEKVSEVNELLEKYKIEYGNQDFNRRIDFTKNGGTFTSFIVRTKAKIDRNIDEIANLRNELIELDKTEKEIGILNYKNANVVELFPIGHFQFPKSETDTFLNILKVEDKKLRKQLKMMLKEFIPVINCYQNPIEKEGYLNGNFEYKGIDSYRNIFRIRKEMFANKFYRKELKFGGH